MHMQILFFSSVWKCHVTRKRGVYFSAQKKSSGTLAVTMRIKIVFVKLYALYVITIISLSSDVYLFDAGDY